MRLSELRDAKIRTLDGETSKTFQTFESKLGLIRYFAEPHSHIKVLRPEKFQTRTDLIKRAVVYGDDVTERSIDVHIQAIRKKLGAYRNMISTVRGAGYRFEG